MKPEKLHSFCRGNKTFSLIFTQKLLTFKKTNPNPILCDFKYFPHTRVRCSTVFHLAYVLDFELFKVQQVLKCYTFHIFFTFVTWFMLCLCLENISIS